MVVSTLFGIIAKADNKDNKVIASLEFQIIKDLINSTPINVMAEEVRFPPSCPPPTSPEDIVPKVIKPCKIEPSLAIKQPFIALNEFEMRQMGPRLKMKRAGLVV